ncbi:hypothetical protein Patl1_27876 [Pistacia atlantica]|uniref:Uncharacterized protein n=1 Tax=Pistacia atlantica TaxID=434234 RepID=A0ACC1BGM4_9ROSI|nr:hypothetical protein Patl1_27876 [Pistacia atlantica]
MASRLSVFLLTLHVQILVMRAVTNPQEFAALKSLKHHWRNTPPDWVGDDPCGSSWEGIRCDNSSVTSIVLSGIGLRGKLPADIQNLPELRTLDLSQNNGLSGTLPPSIGNLTKLVNLLLTGCSFHGLIPDTLGSLTQLVNLYLNSNSFSGPIPASIGNLTNLVLLDLTDNQLNGTIPVSNETSPGLDGLVNALHFHFGRNQLTGPVSLSLFSSEMKLIHVLFDHNNFTGSIPTSLEHLQNLQVIRMDKNSFNGTVSFNFTSFPNITTMQVDYAEKYLSNNQLTGPLPNLTGLSKLNYVDMSNNSFEGSTIPPGFSSLQSLTTLVMENTNLRGPIPVELFSLPWLESVILKNNQLNESLDIGTSYGSQLHLIDVQNNSIEYFVVTGYNKSLKFNDLPVRDCGNDYLELEVKVFPSGSNRFNITTFSMIISQLNNINFVNLSPNYGPSYYINHSNYFPEKKSQIWVMIGATVGGFILLVLLLSGMYAIRQRKKARRATKLNDPFASWNPNDTTTSPPIINGPRRFSFKELKKCTKNFSDTNILGTGGYGQVYKGKLETGDIKSNNILLDYHLTAKVADFGISKTLDGIENSRVTTEVKGTRDTLSGLENFVDLAMRCVEDLGANRPTMSEVVKQIEDILRLADSEPQSKSSVFSITFN